jgi:hypothetical protein|tara:strand:- start:69 stop:284 length:216 start_codon:yes stop_codon:yes gene_type:complete
MIKYILILQICSLTAKDCIEPVRMPDPYDSHYECALAGYEHSIDAFKIIGKDVINQSKSQVQFYCEEINNT